MSTVQTISTVLINSNKKIFGNLFLPLLTLLQQHSYDVSINDALRRREWWVWTELRSIPTCGQHPSKPSDGWKRRGWLVIIWMRVKSIILRLPRSWILDDVAEQMIRRGFVPISFGKIKCKRNQRSFTERMITWKPLHQDNENPDISYLPYFEVTVFYNVKV